VCQLIKLGLNTVVQSIYSMPSATGMAATVTPGSQPELGANRIVLNATKQAPAPQASKILEVRKKAGRGRACSSALACLTSPPLARANSLSTASIRPEGQCQALAELAVTRAGPLDF
jgi:hypothetical protein